jgi:hypothetical protein
MEEEGKIQEIKESLETFEETTVSWNRYLALTTAFIAVVAAVATLVSGNFASKALLEKNDAVLLQNKASDQYAWYQAKGIKKNLAEFLYQQKKEEKLKNAVDRYGKEQTEIKKQADDYAKQVDEANVRSEKLFERHHKVALGVTFFQIAIALSAMSALLKRKSFWTFSIVVTIIGLGFFLIGLLA